MVEVVELEEVELDVAEKLKAESKVALSDSELELSYQL